MTKVLYLRFMRIPRKLRKSAEEFNESIRDTL